MFKPIAATGDVLEVDEGEEDEGAGRDDQHGDAPVPDVLGHKLTVTFYQFLGNLRQFLPSF